MLEYSREELWEISPELGEIRESDDESKTDEDESQEKSPKNAIDDFQSDKQVYKLNRRVSSQGEVDYPPSLHKLADFEEDSPRERGKKRSLNSMIRRGDSGTSFSSSKVLDEDTNARDTASNNYHSVKGHPKRSSIEYSSSNNPRILYRAPSQDDMMKHHDDHNFVDGRYRMSDLQIAERSEEEEGEVDFKPKILAKPMTTPKTTKPLNSGQPLFYEDVDDNDPQRFGDKLLSSERLKTNERLPQSLSQIKRIDEDDF
jgi:hypothetical protein